MNIRSACCAEYSLYGNCIHTIFEEFYYAEENKEKSVDFRTDRNNNPTAFIVQMAEEAGLIPDVEYTQGDPFTVGTETFYTAKLLLDPVQTTIKVIDRLGFYTVVPHARWTYIALPYALWRSLTQTQKRYVIGFMYSNEGGVSMKKLFPSEPV